MAAQELFIEYRGEFEALFLDVEDEIAILVEQGGDPDVVVATPGPDVIRVLRSAFGAADYARGPIGPVPLIGASCLDPAVAAVLLKCGVDVDLLRSSLSDLDEDHSDAFRGWLAQLVRRRWYRNQWTREFARLLAHAALEGGLRHRSHFSAADILVASWCLEQPVLSRFELPHLALRRIKSVLAHGVVTFSPEFSPALMAGGLVNIRLFYDVYSSVTLVAEVIQGILGAPDVQSHLQAIYHLGSHAIGPFGAEDAMGRVHRAQKLAEAQDAPLRLTVEPIDD